MKSPTFNDTVNETDDFIKQLQDIPDPSVHDSIDLNDTDEQELPKEVYLDIPKSQDPSLPPRPLFIYKPLDTRPPPDNFALISSPLISDLKDIGHPDNQSEADPDLKFHFQNAKDFDRFVKRKQNTVIKPTDIKQLIKDAEVKEGPRFGQITSTNMIKMLGVNAQEYKKFNKHVL